MKTLVDLRTYITTSPITEASKKTFLLTSVPIKVKWSHLILVVSRVEVPLAAIHTSYHSLSFLPGGKGETNNSVS